jgi:hypothetical protein
LLAYGGGVLAAGPVFSVIGGGKEGQSPGPSDARRGEGTPPGPLSPATGPSGTGYSPGSALFRRTRTSSTGPTPLSLRLPIRDRSKFARTPSLGPRR